MGIESPIHLIFIGIVALLVLGPRRLPELARRVGEGVREFRESIDAGAEDHDAPPEEAVATTATPTTDVTPTADVTQPTDVTSTTDVSQPADANPPAATATQPAEVTVVAPPPSEPGQQPPQA